MAEQLTNNPPPFEAHSLHIEDLIAEAQNFLDGEEISNQGQADAVTKLLDDIREARKGADAQRDAEKRPFDEQAKEIQAKWKPLLARCDTAADIAKQALTPWRLKADAEKKAAADKAREEANAKAQAAIDAQRAAAASNDLKAAEEAQALQKQADAAQKAARKAEKGGATGLRTSYRAEITNYITFARWAWEHLSDEMREALDVMAKGLATGPKDIPGLVIHTERGAV